MSDAHWLTVRRGDAPLLVSIPHTGTELAGLDERFVSPWLARADTDWWIDQLYDFAAGLGATVVRTAISRTVIDVNRDPSGASLYPGQATTGLCPTDHLRRRAALPPGQEPDAGEIAAAARGLLRPLSRRACRPRSRGCGRCIRTIVLYDCHSIRSALPRLFDGQLPRLQPRHQRRHERRSRPCRRRSSRSWPRTGWSCGRQRPLQGRLDHPPLRPPARRRPRDPDGARQPRLSCASPRARSSRRTGRRPTIRAFAAPMRATLTDILEAALAWARS